MKILFLTTQFPYPLDNGGKIGAFNGISILSTDNQLTVMSFTEENFIEEGLNFYKEKYPQVTFFPPIPQYVHIQKRPFQLVKVMCKSYIRHIPYIAIKFENHQMYTQIERELAHVQYDIIFIDYLNMFLYGQYITKKYPYYRDKIIIKDHNIEFRIYQQAAKSSRGLKRLVLNHEWKKVREYEIRALRAGKLIFSVCDEDADYISQYNSNVYAMKPTFEILPERKALTERKALLYIGNLSWRANLKGLRWFLDEVWPSLLEQFPDITIDIVGGGLKENPFSDIKGVNYRGYIKDIDSIYNDFRVFVVPLFEGSGIRIKILEAFNHDIAVVSTKMACETIGAIDGKELMIVDTAKEFAEKVALLLLDEIKNNTLRNNAKKFLEQRYSLKARQEEIGEIISERT